MISNPSLQVSVAMCTYNGARFIEEQLWSIFRQTYLPSELIVSDDNSSDDTLPLVEKTYLEASNSIPGVNKIVLKIKRNMSSLGVTKNFEQAISLCTNELIALSDQDDVWAENRLMRILDEFKNRPELLLLHHDSRLVDENLKPIGLSTFEALRVTKKEKRLIHSGMATKVLIRRNLITGATTVFNKSLVDKSRPFPENWLHDEWLGFVASCNGRVDFLGDQLIDYRQHSNNQIGIRKITMRQLFGKILYPRTSRNSILLSRSKELLELSMDEKNLDCKSLIFEKYRHELVRSSYPISRCKRLVPVGKEIITGSYRNVGLGFQDILRDVFQSPK